MDIGIISVRYARALLKSAIDKKLGEQVYDEMTTLAKCYIEVPQLRFTIDNPMLAADKKQKLIETACGGEVSSLTKAFIALVLKENREKFLQFMANSFVGLYRKQKNIISGRLITAAPVSPAIEQKMKQRSEEHTSELQSPDQLVCRLLLEKNKYFSCSFFGGHTSISSSNFALF